MAHRRFGKTCLVLNEILKKCMLNTLPSPKYGYIAPTYRMAKQAADKLNVEEPTTTSEAAETLPEVDAETEAAATRIQAAVRSKKAKKTFQEKLAEKNAPSKAAQEKADEASDTDPVICKAIVDYDYDANGDDELSLREGEEIEVTEIDDSDGWWHGKLNGKFGAFPYNYVHLVLERAGKQYRLTTEDQELYEYGDEGEFLGTYDRDTNTFTDHDGNQEIWEDANLVS